MQTLLRCLSCCSLGLGAACKRPRGPVNCSRVAPSRCRSPLSAAEATQSRCAAGPSRPSPCPIPLQSPHPTPGLRPGSTQSAMAPGAQARQPRQGRRPRPLQPPSVLSNLQVSDHRSPRGPPGAPRPLAAAGPRPGPRLTPLPPSAPQLQSLLLHTAPTLPLYSDPDSPSSSSASFTLADLWCVPCTIPAPIACNRRQPARRPPVPPPHRAAARGREQLVRNTSVSERRRRRHPRPCRQSYEAWSAYGCEVPLRINVDGVWQEVRAVDRSACPPRKRPPVCRSPMPLSAPPLGLTSPPPCPARYRR